MPPVIVLLLIHTNQEATWPVDGLSSALHEQCSAFLIGRLLQRLKHQHV